MDKRKCECYYDAALHRQSTGCQIHDPYEENRYLKEQLAALLRELEQERKRLDWMEKYRPRIHKASDGKIILFWDCPEILRLYPNGKINCEAEGSSITEAADQGLETLKRIDQWERERNAIAQAEGGRE